MQSATCCPSGTANRERVSYAWAEANDCLNFANGVADNALDNGMLTDAALVSIDPATASIDNESIWKDLIPAGAHIITTRGDTESEVHFAHEETLTRCDCDTGGL